MKNISLHFHKKNQNGQVKHVLPGQRTFFQLITKDPWVDWVLILAVSGIIAVTLIIVGVYVYTTNIDRNDNPGSVTGAIDFAKRFDDKSLKVITDTFDARARERVLLQQGYKGPSDPSLP